MTDSQKQATQSDPSSLMHQWVHGLPGITSQIDELLELVEEQAQESDSDMRLLRAGLADLRDETSSLEHHANSTLVMLLGGSAVLFDRPQMGRHRPTDLVLSAMAPYVKRAERRGIDIELESAAEAWKMFPEMWLEHRVIRRVLHNVLSNALKYSHHGLNTDRSIRIWAKRHDPHGRLWALCVQNYGIGIDEDERTRIFTFGFRGRAALRDKIGGAGLGLADMQLCMRAHGGEVIFDSKRVNAQSCVTTVTLVFSTAGEFKGTRNA